MVFVWSVYLVVLMANISKLDKFQKRKAVLRNETKPFMYIKHTVHNFSSYILSDKEYKALNYSFDHHIPRSSNYNTVETEFKLFYQNIYEIFWTSLKTNKRSCKDKSSIQIQAYYC